MSTEKKEPNNQESVEVRTFGCRVNLYESELIRQHALNAGQKNSIIFNTCAVTKEAERQAKQAIRKARRERPDADIIVTGCAAQINPQSFMELDAVDRVIGNVEKLDPAQWQPGAPTLAVNDIMQVTHLAPQMLKGFNHKTRAFVQVQQGCDHRCTFCVIPYGRGNSRSAPLGDIVGQVRHLVEQGTKEVVLTGVDITSYGQDLPGKPSLGQMMRRLLAAVPELARLRLSSLDSIEADQHLFWLLAEEPRFMPHLHLSLQAGHNLILKRMKRRHLREDAIAFCQKARAMRPDIVFGADFITGFPTETEEHFRATLDLVEEAGLSYLHIFPYSSRAGTAAAKMPQVDKTIRKERAARLKARGQTQLKTLYDSAIGKRVRVLTEQGAQGRSEQFLPVALPHQSPGELITLRLLNHNGKIFDKTEPGI